MLASVRMLTQMNNENPQLFKLLLSAISLIPQVLLATTPRMVFLVLKNEGLISEPMNLNEKDYRKMLESYTGIQLKGYL